MDTGKVVLGLVGSPNPEGRTNQLVTAALEGAENAGAVVEKVQMSEYVVDACRDCLPWVCVENLKCSFEDRHFEYLSEKILNCGGLILGTPIYWWDTSGMVKYLILKMFRVYARSGPLDGLPAFGIGIAGGTGNGLISGLRPVYHFFQMMRMRALDPLPVTRFDFKEAMTRAGELGGEIAGMINRRKPFVTLEERLRWYDRLPYLGESRAGERRLLAASAHRAVSGDGRAPVGGDLAKADILAASGRSLESLTEVTRVYESSIKLFEEKQS